MADVVGITDVIFMVREVMATHLVCEIDFKEEIIEMVSTHYRKIHKITEGARLAINKIGTLEEVATLAI